MSITTPAATPGNLLRRWLVPSLPDVFFVCVIAGHGGPSTGSAIAAFRWRHRLAHPYGRIDLADRARAGGRSVFLQPPAAAVVRLGMARRRGVRRDLAVARTGGGRRAGGRGARARGHGDAGAHSAPRLRIVDRAGRDDGRGERFEHSLPGAAARLFDPFIHAGALDPGRRSRSSWPAGVAAGAADRALGKSACRLCGLAGHAGASGAVLRGSTRVAGPAPLRYARGALLRWRVC